MGQVIGVGRRCQPEVGDPDIAVDVEQQVRRLDVAMQNALVETRIPGPRPPARRCGPRDRSRFAEDRSGLTPSRNRARSATTGSDSEPSVLAFGDKLLGEPAKAASTWASFPKGRSSAAQVPAARTWRHPRRCFCSRLHHRHSVRTRANSRLRSPGALRDEACSSLPRPAGAVRR